MNDSQSGSPAPSWRGPKDQERVERRAARDGGAWIVGAVLIVVGAFLLLPNFGLAAPTNWWALFILIPAVACLAASWRIVTGAGSAVAAVGPFLVGLVLLGVTVAFLFELTLNWGLIGPLVLIVLGVGLLAGALGWKR